MNNSITLNTQTFSKQTYRIGLFPWCDLFPMTSDEVHAALTSLTNIDNISDLEALADWACLNQPSMSFDFPKEDRLKALLGALRWEYITLS